MDRLGEYLREEITRNHQCQTLEALIDRVFAWDIDPQAVRRFTAQMPTELGLEVTPVDVLRDATLASDIIARQ